MTDQFLQLVRSGLRVYDLARPYEIGMPQSPRHPVYCHTLPRRHGDHVRDDGGSAANDLILMGTHVGTHMDALAHVSHEGKLHGGIEAAASQVGGRFPTHGIDEFAPGVYGCVLLDVPAALGVDACAPAYEIGPDDLEAAAARCALELHPGEVILVRPGWGKRWDDGEADVGKTTGVPGVGEARARWLAKQSPCAVGSDTIAFEHLPAGKGHASLPAHRVLLVEHGINIIETLNLEPLALDEVCEFALTLTPLPLSGATGSPLRPLALVSDPSREPEPVRGRRG
jgi:kynurenine formamidase